MTLIAEPPLYLEALRIEKSTFWGRALVCMLKILKVSPDGQTVDLDKTGCVAVPADFFLGDFDEEDTKSRGSRTEIAAVTVSSMPDGVFRPSRSSSFSFEPPPQDLRSSTGSFHLILDIHDRPLKVSNHSVR